MSQSTRKVVVFDASPNNDPTPWMKKACQASGVFLADINAIAVLLAEDPQARPLLLARGPVGEDPKLAPYYRAALDKLAHGMPKVAVHSVVWIDYGLKPEAAVLDFDNLELERAKATRLGLDGASYDKLVADARAQMESRLKGLAKERVLTLPAKASDARKAELAAAHIKKFLK